MGHYEDFFYEAHEQLEKLGLRDKFDKQLKKMNEQSKHNYKDTRDRWSYALEKVVKENKNKNK